MRIFDIFDEENSITIGTLLYYEKERSFIIELVDTLDEWTAPLLLTSYVKKGIFTIPRDVSFLWVKERIIPSGRQNIDSILKKHKLKSYDEMKFLEFSEGRCSQDSLFIKKTDSLPEYVQKRILHNLTETVVLEDYKMICFFADKTIRKIDFKTLPASHDMKKILGFKILFESAKVGTGGYFVTFDDSIDIPARLLYKSGKKIPLEPEDFISFAQKNICDTSETCIELECSRQNVSYMISHDMLTPVKENVKGNLYLRGDVIKNLW